VTWKFPENVGGQSKIIDGKNNGKVQSVSCSSKPPRTFICYAPTKSRLRVIRDGHSIIRSAGVPKPTILVDTREQDPFPLLANHPNWIGGERRVGLKIGDYGIEGMEGLLALERKSLADIVSCTVTCRQRFITVCARLAQFRWKAILVEAAMEDIKHGFEQFDIPSEVHPNAVCGFLDAIGANSPSP
jgi:ERCC4-type nuclease